MPNQDGKVVINIDSNASKTQREFEALDITTARYNQTLKITTLLTKLCKIILNKLYRRRTCYC